MARTISIQAARELYGINSCEEKAVTDAWYAVGVGAAFTGNVIINYVPVITGADAICGVNSTQNYTVNLPTGATAVWTPSNANISVAVLTPNGSDVAVTNLTNVGTTQLLTATITSTQTGGCNPPTGTYTKTKQIILGIPDVDRFMVYGNRFDYSIYGPQRNYIVCPSENLTIYPNLLFSDLSTILEHEWEYVSGTYNLFTGGNYSGAYVNTSSSVGATLTLRYRYRNDCGWSNWDYVDFTNMDCDGGEEPSLVGGGGFDFTLSPNPVKHTVTITTKNMSNSFEVRVFDLQSSKPLKFARYVKWHF